MIDDAAELFDSAPCGYLLTTPDGLIVRANGTFLEFSGYERAELDGRSAYDLFSAGGRIYFETHVAPLLRMGGAARELAFDLVRRDGTRLPVLVNAVLDRDEAGRPCLIRMAVFSATHRREYERELLRAKQRAEASEARAVALAKTLQQTLIPPSPPAIPRLDVAARYRAAGDGTEVGGDFYDVFQVGPAEWVAAIGDVCGKGVEAAVVTALARHTLRRAAMASGSPSAALTELNAELRCRKTTRFCSVVLARLREGADGWAVRLSSAGHPPPLYRHRAGTVEYAGTLGGSILGIWDRLNLTDVDLPLWPGDAVLLYTDGVPEARCGDEFYGEERLVALLGQPHPSADAMVDTVLGDVLSFQDGAARDDIALVAIRVPE